MIVESKTGRIFLDRAFYGDRDLLVYHAWGRNSAVRLERHFHGDYVISAQLQGKEHCMVGRSDFCFEAGDLVLINPNQPHTWNEDRVEDNEYISISVSRAMVETLARQLGAPNLWPEFTQVRARGHLGVGMIQEICDVYRAGAKPESFDDRIHRLAREMLVSVFSDHSNMFEPRRRSSSRVGQWRIAKVLEQLAKLSNTELQVGISLDELSQSAGLSRFHFLRQFTEVVGMTPGRYVRMVRLCRAGRLLRSSNESVLEIAGGVGFADHAAFSRAFASQMGMTPSNYRWLGRKKSNSSPIVA